MKIEITDAWWLSEALNVNFRITLEQDKQHPEEIFEEDCLLFHAEDLRRCFDDRLPGAVPWRGLIGALNRRGISISSVEEVCLRKLYEAMRANPGGMP